MQYAQHIHNTHSGPKSILTNTPHAVIGRWWLLIIPYSWCSWLDFNAVHVHERSKELLHVVHNARRLCTMYSLGGILITWTIFANRGQSSLNYFTMCVVDWSLIHEDFVANGVQNMFKSAAPLTTKSLKPYRHQIHQNQSVEYGWFCKIWHTTMLYHLVDCDGFGMWGHNILVDFGRIGLLAISNHWLILFDLVL